MNEISIVTFKWQKPSSGYKLKSPVEYSADHVNILHRSIKRNTTLPYRFYCVTDNSNNLDKEINFIPLWDKCRSLGGCYNRLFIFSEEMKNLFGDRFLCIDLDCVITGNLDNLLSRKEDFIINKFLSKGGHNQIYNGGLIMMNSGARKEVWEKFDPIKSVELLDIVRNEQKLVGSDQAWIQVCLGENESQFDETDGIYDYSFLENQLLPANAKIVFFPGKVDPSQEKNKISWIEKYWN